MTTATLHRRRTSKTWRMAAACMFVLINGVGVDDLGVDSLVVQGLSGLGQAHAQSVYRCGSSYSNDASCAQGEATSVALQGETAHAAKPVNGLAQHMQSEADRLEKLRLREESTLAKHQPTTLRPAPKAISQKPLTERSGEHKKKKRKKSLPASPYFTAKGKAEGQKP